MCPDISDRCKVLWRSLMKGIPLVSIGSCGDVFKSFPFCAVLTVHINLFHFLVVKFELMSPFFQWKWKTINCSPSLSSPSCLGRPYDIHPLLFDRRLHLLFFKSCFSAYPSWSSELTHKSALKLVPGKWMWPRMWLYQTLTPQFALEFVINSNLSLSRSVILFFFLHLFYFLNIVLFPRLCFL